MNININEENSDNSTIKKDKIFDNFEWLLSLNEVRDKKSPSISELDSSELRIVRGFYSKYVRRYGSDYILKKIDTLENKTAKLWAIFSMQKIPSEVRLGNKDFENNLRQMLSKIKLPFSSIIEVFKPYMPFFTDYDIFKFAFDNVDSPLYRYFYLLLIYHYGWDYPADASKEYPQNYEDCPFRWKEKCEFKGSCITRERCVCFERKCGKHYDFAKEMNDFQKNMTLSFLSLAPKKQKATLLVKFYESLQQINQTGFFDAKLSLSYDKVLYKAGKPLTGRFYLRWDKVEFFNGFYTIRHPNVPFNKQPPLRVEDTNSRKALNEVSSFFKKKLPPLYVVAKHGRIVKVINKTDLASCISVMEHKVSAPDVSRKKAEYHKAEKKEITSKEAKNLCKELKSRYLDYLCAKHLDNYKVICCIENRVNSNAVVSCEYSFIFTIKETLDTVYLAYENASESRCTYLFPVSRRFWKLGIEKVYDFFASNEVNKRKSMASRLVDLQLPGNYAYKRLFHTDYLSWVDKIKYCL